MYFAGHMVSILPLVEPENMLHSGVKGGYWGAQGPVILYNTIHITCVQNLGQGS